MITIEKVPYPDDMDEDLRQILGRLCFMCIGPAEALRASGIEIRRKAEDEQAAVIHWLLKLYLKHGTEWRKFAAQELNSMLEQMPPRAS